MLCCFFHKTLGNEKYISIYFSCVKCSRWSGPIIILYILSYEYWWSSFQTRDSSLSRSQETILCRTDEKPTSPKHIQFGRNMRPNGIFGGTPRSIVGRYIPTTIIIRNGSGNQILGWKLKAMMLYITDIWELVLHHLVSVSFSFRCWTYFDERGSGIK